MPFTVYSRHNSLSPDIQRAWLSIARLYSWGDKKVRLTHVTLDFFPLTRHFFLQSWLAISIGLRRKFGPPHSSKNNERSLRFQRTAVPCQDLSLFPDYYNDDDARSNEDDFFPTGVSCLIHKKRLTCVLCRLIFSSF